MPFGQLLGDKQYSKETPLTSGRSVTVHMQLKADIGVVSWDLLGFGKRLRLGLNTEEQM